MRKKKKEKSASFIFYILHTKHKTENVFRVFPCEYKDLLRLALFHRRAALERIVFLERLFSPLH